MLNYYPILRVIPQKVWVSCEKVALGYSLVVMIASTLISRQLRVSEEHLCGRRLTDGNETVCYGN